MIRRFFLQLATFSCFGPSFEEEKQEKRNLDKLVARYNQLFESVTNVGEDTVCYDRDVWNGIREAFADIIRAVRV